MVLHTCVKTPGSLCPHLTQPGQWERGEWEKPAQASVRRGWGCHGCPGAWEKDAERSRVSRAGRCLPGRGWLGARTSCSHPEQGFGHLGAAAGESTLLREWKQGEVGASNLPTVGFTKNLVSNLTGERREDGGCQGCTRSYLSKRPCKTCRKYPGGSLGWQSFRSCWRRFRGVHTAPSG